MARRALVSGVMRPLLMSMVVLCIGADVATAESAKVDGAKPKAEPTKPAAAKAEPTKAEPTRPTTEPTKPTSEPTKPTAAKAEPTKVGPTGPTKVTAQPTKPSSAPAMSTTAKGEAADDEEEMPPAPRAKERSKAKSGAKPGGVTEAGPEVVEGSSPASPPPLTLGGLRDEMNRGRGTTALDPAAPARTKLEQMLDEVAKARASLQQDTARLEAMLTQDGEAAPGQAPAPGGVAPKPPKNPLDVLAKALRGIKPEQAAPIVSRLDRRLAATVLQRMPPVDAGKIMGAMKPDTAAELATQIAMRPLAPTGQVKR